MASKIKKKLEIILIYAYFAYRIELMTSRMLSRRLRLPLLYSIYQLSYIPNAEKLKESCQSFAC